MQRVTIKKIYTTNVGKDGKPLVSTFGEYTRQSIIVNEPEFESKWISGIMNPTTMVWKEGDVVELLIEKTAQGYYRWKLPRNFGGVVGKAVSTQIDTAELDALKLRVTELERQLEKLTSAKKELDAIADSIPF